MSADRWTTCPRCEATEIERVSQLKLDAGKSYGKVTPEEYLKLLDEANVKPEVEETFREDYSIGLYEGKFEVDYSGSCEKCGLEHRFKHEQELTNFSTATNVL